MRFERNRGVRILEVSIKDIEEIYAIRLLLEPPSAFMAAVNASAEQKQELQEIFEVLRAAAKADAEEIANYRLPFADWIEHIKPD